MKNPFSKWIAGTIVGLLTLLFLATGCTSTSNTITSQGGAPEEAYPPQPLQILPQSAYPGPDTEPVKPLLALDKPLRTGDTRVTGVGLPGLTVELINITFMGEQLGTGVVGSDATFEIALDPLPGGIRIGLSADIESLNLTLDDFQLTEGTISMPQVGYFFDSAVTLQN